MILIGKVGVITWLGPGEHLHSVHSHLCPFYMDYFLCGCILSWWSRWLKTYGGNQGINYCGMLKRKSYSAAWQPLPRLLAGIDGHKCLSVSAPNPRYLILTEYRASSHQRCNWGHLYCRKEASNNKQWTSWYLPVVTFLDGCWRQNIGLNEGKLKVSPTMDLSHWTFLDHWKRCGIL